jgi:hypothetical protein
MTSNDKKEPASAEKSDWKSAWEAISRLAAVREPLRGPNDADDPVSASHSANTWLMESYSTTGSGKSITTLTHEELATAVAEIERASARLRQSEPVLEAGLPSASAGVERGTHRSIWILIGAIWLSATLAVASATGAILYLLG